MSVYFSMRTVTSALVCASFWLVIPEAARAASCDGTPPASFDVREDPFNLSADERGAIIDVVHAFALTWDLRDNVNLPLLFIDGRPDNDFVFLVCNSASGVGGTGLQIGSAVDRQQIKEYFDDGPFAYVMNVETPDANTTSQARHFISTIVVKSHRLGDVKVVANLLVTLQYYGDGVGLPVDDPTFPVVDYTGWIEAVLTKEWGGVWKFRELVIYMDVTGGADSFRGR